MSIRRQGESILLAAIVIYIQLFFLSYVFPFASNNTVIGYIKKLSSRGFEVFTLCSFKCKTAFLSNSARSRIFNGVRYANPVYTNFGKEIVNDCFCSFRHKAFIPISVTHTVAKLCIFAFFTQTNNADIANGLRLLE